MRKLTVIVLCLIASLSVFAQETDTAAKEVSSAVTVTRVYPWMYSTADLRPGMPAPTIQWMNRRKTDRGIFGGVAGSTRIYCDITMPTLTSECLVDVGAAMSRMGGLLGSCTRWFTMFDPNACPSDELFGSAKANTAIMLTMRTYF